MKNFFRIHWPVLAVVAAYLVTTGVMAALSMQSNQGRLVYALDDAYIHMALAKNLATHGVWGVTPFNFSSSVSSLLWPLLLSLSYVLFGVNQASPLVFNLLSGALTIVVAGEILRRYKASSIHRVAALLVFTFLSVMAPLTLQGMEHLLQMAVTLLATFLAARWLSDDPEINPRREFLYLLLVAPLVTVTRFEGMFLILVIGALILIRRRGWHAVRFGASAFLPLAIFGFISILKGWYGLPNSVLVKGKMPVLSSVSKAITSSLGAGLLNLASAPHVVAVTLAVLFLYVYTFRARGAWESRQLMTAIFIGATWLHLEFAIVCLYCRYDAYLISLGVLIAATQLVDQVPRGALLKRAFQARGSSALAEKSREPEEQDRATRWNNLPQHLATAGLAGILLLPLGTRAVWVSSFTLTGTTNIFQQQYQMGLFMRKYYQASTVALNDIGAVNFLAGVHCVDLMGLANMPVARKRLRNNFHTVDILAVARQSGARVAVVYDSWFGGDVGGLPANWTKVGEWTITNNVMAADKTVSFYAVEPSEVIPLIQHLRDFSSQLPPSVLQSGKYTEWASVP